MYARVTRYEVPADKLDEDVRGAEATQQRVAGMPGSRGLYYLVDRDSGKTMAITLWDDEQSMRDSEDAASKLRDETSTAASARIVGIERYEVATEPARVPTARA